MDTEEIKIKKEIITVIRTDIKHFTKDKAIDLLKRNGVKKHYFLVTYYDGRSDHLEYFNSLDRALRFIRDGGAGDSFSLSEVDEIFIYVEQSSMEGTRQQEIYEVE